MSRHDYDEASPEVDATQLVTNATVAVRRIATCKETIDTVRAILREQSPEAMAALEEAEAELPRLQEASKPVLRELGAGTHSLAGYSIRVGAAPMQTRIDTEGLVQKAKARGEVDDLLDAGLLKYEVVPHQLARLTSRHQAIYSSFVTAVPGTPSVSLPAELK